MLRVRLLGGLALEGLEPPASRPARELLGWLALHPGAHSRLELALRLWPDVPEASARASLRTTLHELRRALGDAATHLRVDRERVELADVWVDVHHAQPEDARGDLLAGIDRDWVLAARDEHRERVATRLAELADAAAEPTVALGYARALALHDPLSEAAARRLMRAYAAAGDRAAALSAYLRLEERLERELSLRPSTETRRLLAELRAGTAPPLGTGARERRLGDDPREDPRGDEERRNKAAGADDRPRGDGDGRGDDALGPDDRRRAPARPALPAALARRTGPLAGRTGELARIAAQRPPAALLLAGEPGIGKTRLLAEAARRAHAAGAATVLYGRCHEEHLTPYEPFVEALGDLALLAPEGAPESARWRLFEAVGARVAGSLLVLDDIHWADSGTLRLLAHVLRRPDAPTVLAAYRDSEVSRAHPLADALADLRRDGLVERIALRGLPEAAVAELVPAGDAARLHAQTGGNPFFIEQVLADDGGEGIPEGVKDVIGRRLNRLAPDTGRVLAIAAVAGREFSVAPIEAVLPDLDVLQALDEAAAARMVTEERGGRYAFVHALVRETLYDELSLTRRVRTHQALAGALAELPGTRLAELAHHHLEGGTPEAAETALAAAGEAMRALAYEEAAALCERALELAPDDPRLLLALGEARLRTGEPARDVFARAARGGDPEVLARAALGHSGLGVTIIAVDAPTVALLERALERLPETHPLRARALARLAIETYYVSTPQRRKALVDEAVELARRQPHPAALLDALNARHAALWSPEYLDERERTADELVELAAELGDPERELQGRNWRVLDRFERGDVAGMRVEIEAHERLADRLRLPAYTWWAPMWRATLAILEGRFAEAERLIDPRSVPDDANAALYAEIQRYALLWAREDFGSLGGMAPLEREIGRPAEYAYRAGFAWVLAGQGRDDEARAQVEWVAADGFARLGDDMNRIAALAELAEAIDPLGDPTHAGALLERLLPYADRNITNARAAAGYGSAAHHVAVLTALLGRHDEADARFEAALDANLALGARPWAARTRERHAALLAARGEHERARPLAAAALATARELGMPALERRAAALT